MRKFARCIVGLGLVWSAAATAVPVYHTYGYYGDGGSWSAGDNALFTFTMEYDLDRQPVRMSAQGELVTTLDAGLRANPDGPFFGHYQLDYFHAALVDVSAPLDVDYLGRLNESTSFRQIAGSSGPTPQAYEDVVRWSVGDDYIQLVRYPGVVDAEVGANFPFIADMKLGSLINCAMLGCGESLYLINVSANAPSIPEPGTLGLLAVGAAGLAFSMRRRARQTAVPA